MKLVAKTKLDPQVRHWEALEATQQRNFDACMYAAAFALDHEITAQSQLHNAIYHEVKRRYDLGAQMTIRCISRVADLAKQGKLEHADFHPEDAIVYDYRILTWDLENCQVSIWTVHGRKTMPFACGPHQLELLSFQRGECDLISYEGAFYLTALCEVDRLREIDLQGVWD